MTRVSMIVAMDENRLIGRDNALPWHLPADLAHFKRTTMGKPIVMGRKTWQSIGRPLPGRQNIVVTRNPDFTAAGCDLADSIESALALAGDVDEIMLIGGAGLYAQAMPLASRLYLTLIHHRFAQGDAWFPEIGADWTIAEQRRFDADQDNPYPFSFINFVREI
ncbi:MAG: dihydrofolate reductase [Gammaproteobacteria bacterium]|nr:dihydrofolate reductase [Gammaproteobacteria bacterium]